MMWPVVCGSPRSTDLLLTATAYASLQTVGSLLLTNSDFRLFLSDLSTIGRQVFADSAFSLSSTASQVGKAVEPSADSAQALQGPGADQAPAPTNDDLTREAQSVGDAVADGLAQTGHDTVSSAKEHLSGDEKATILHRLKQAVLKLRQRPDYNDSVSTIGMLIERYMRAYSRVADRTIEVAEEDIHRNEELDRAAQNFWSLLSSFGNEHEWKQLEAHFQKVLTHTEKDMDFEALMTHVATSVQSMLTDPSFFDDAEEKLAELRTESQSIGIEGSMRRDVDDLLAQIRRTFRSVVHDEHVAKLIATAWKILSVLFPGHALTNAELLDDLLYVFVPLLISAIQYFPIPRLEVSVPEMDLLLENVILEPGKTVNASSFLPYRLKISTQNDVEVRKARFRTATASSSITTIQLDGLSIRAEELGYMLRLHTGLFRLVDSGIASFELDHRGIDVHIDVELSRHEPSVVLSLRDVRVTIHHLNYSLGKSKLRFLAWLLKPLLRPIIRKTMERQLAKGLNDFFHFVNRELVHARERLRATRIADPKDLMTFVKAIAARFVPEEDPDVFTAFGVWPQSDIFKGKYAPGSLVKLWEDEARRAGERIEDEERRGWRNGVFDVQAALMT
jgi:Family of unknown function (DUF5923)/Protein of unknown function (DUF4449)